MTDGDHRGHTIDYRTVRVHATNLPPEASFCSTCSGFSAVHGARSGRSVELSGDAFDADGSISGYDWDLDGDGSFEDATGAVAETMFDLPGAYRVGLRVGDDGEAQTTTLRTVHVAPNQPPSGYINAFPRRISAGESVSFSGYFRDEDGTVKTREWDLDGDGSFDDSDQPSLSYTYDVPGEYLVQVRVTDDEGGQATDAITVHVGEEPGTPQASFSRSGYPPHVGQRAHFNAFASDPYGSALEYTWDLDADGAFDDASGSAASPAFDTAGDHLVRLRVSNATGKQTVEAHKVQILPNSPPLASFALSSRETYRARPAEQVTLQSSATDYDGSVVSFDWDLDDDGEFDDSNSPNPTQAYVFPGQHLVGLRVTDNFGAVTEFAHTVHVVENQRPNVQISATRDPPAAGVPVYLSAYADDDGTVSGYAWDLDDDGEFDDSVDPGLSWTFSSEGDHVIKLKVTDDDGVSSIETRSLHVVLPPFNTAIPSIESAASGDPALEGSTGNWTGYAPIEYFYEWLRCDPAGGDCTPIDDAYEQRYKPRVEDLDQALRVRVYAYNSADGGSVDSKPWGPIEAVNRTSPSLSLSLSEQDVVGDVGTWHASKSLVFGRQWLRCDEHGDRCEPIPGAIDQTYRLSARDSGQRLRLLVTPSNAAGAVPARSRATRTIPVLPPENIEPPAVTGTARQGDELTTSDGSWLGPITSRFTYRWRRCGPGGDDCDLIFGATRPTYTPAASDVGHTLRARVIATNAAGSGSSDSGASAVIQGTAPRAQQAPGDNGAGTANGPDACPFGPGSALQDCALAVPDRTPPKVTLEVPSRQRLAGLLAQGLKVKVGCNEACTIRITATADRPKGDARRRRAPIGSGFVRLARAGRKTVFVKFPRRNRATLRKAHALLTRVVATNANGLSTPRTTRFVLSPTRQR